MNCKNSSKHRHHNLVLIILVLPCLMTNALYSQATKDEFIYLTKTIYHSLQYSGLDNFSAWITSDDFLDKTAKILRQRSYPLEIVWKNPDQLFFIKRPVPETGGPDQNSLLKNLANRIYKELQAVLKIWQKFAAGNPMATLPQNHLFTVAKDSVYIKYEKYENNRRIHVDMSYGINGICGKIVSFDPVENEKKFIYPCFSMIDEKWLCHGWTLKHQIGNQLEKIEWVTIDSEKIEQYWIPKKIMIKTQKLKHIYQQETRSYILNNVLLNKNLKVITN